MTDRPSHGDTRQLTPRPPEPKKPLKPTSLPEEPVRSPWAVRFIAKDHSIPIQLRVDDQVTIGRADPEADFQPQLDLTPYGAIKHGISRRHAEIRAGKDYLVVLDLGSTNGTRLNRHHLNPHEPYRLSHGDLLEFGTLEFEVQISVMPVHDGVKVVKKSTGLLGQRDDEENKTGKHRQILIVEHDEDAATAFASMIRSIGYEAHIVTRTGDAMRFIASDIPDGVFVNFHMPDHPGTDICRMIKNDLSRVHVPIFMISSQTDETSIKEALDAGADVFLSKPVGMNELIEGLHQFVGDPIIKE